MKTLLQQIEDKFTVGPGCWEWTGATNGRYGILHRRPGTMRAHRAVYEICHGPIPAGLTLDHLCRNTACVRPSHLEPVTQAENNRRAAALRTHCPHGHEYSASNTRIEPDGSRKCRTCDAHRHRLQRQRRKQTT